MAGHFLGAYQGRRCPSWLPHTLAGRHTHIAWRLVLLAAGCKRWTDGIGRYMADCIVNQQWLMQPPIHLLWPTPKGNANQQSAQPVVGCVPVDSILYDTL